MKYLLLLAVVAVVLLAWKKRRSLSQGQSAPTKPTAPPTPGSPPNAVAPAMQMVACDVCGLHLPRQDAVASAQGLYYCSPAHQQRAES
jgi:uncharacterized protein